MSCNDFVECSRKVVANLIRDLLYFFFLFAGQLPRGLVLLFELPENDLGRALLCFGLLVRRFFGLFVFLP